MKKKLLLLTLLVVGQAFSQSLQLVGPTGITNPGTSAALNIVFANSTVVGAPKVTALQFNLTTPNSDFGQLTAVAGPAAIAAGKEISCNIFAPVTVGTTGGICIVWGLNNNPIGDGVVAIISAPVLVGAKLSVETEGLLSAIGSDAAGNSVTIASMGGTFQIYNTCDLNRDGVMDIADVNLVVAQGIASLTGTGVTCTTGDLNGDKKCNVLDVYREVVAALPVGTVGVPGAGVCKVGP